MNIQLSPNTITSELMLIAPWPMLLVGLAAGIRADRHARLMRKLTTGATGFALLCAVLTTVTCAVGWTQSVTFFSISLPVNLDHLAVSVDVNDLTVFMFLIVAFVGMIVTRYSQTYLDGDTYEGRFHRWLSLTLGSFLMLISSGNLWGFLIFWVTTSLSLHELLAFYRERPVAVLAARKKYLLHRLADASLFAAFVLIARTLHTSQFAGVAPALSAIHGPLPAALQVASGLVVVSAVLKSAQFPFHGWLIQVMESPTPVSALLHAGIIYTGAFLILRLVPIMSRVGWAGDGLIFTGLVSIATASLMMMTATSIKGSLAYSTSAQMGFMLMECGLGLYSLAVLHIISHSVYKAHAFLSSGSVVDHFRVPALPASSRHATLWQAMWSLVIAASTAIGIGTIFGVFLPQQPALTVMGVILTVALSQLFLQALNVGNRRKYVLILAVMGLGALVSAAYFGLDKWMTALLGEDLPAVRGSGGVIWDGLLGLIVLVFLGLLMIQQMFPRILDKPFWQRAYVHLYNGLYMDMFLTRLVRSFGPIGAAGPLRVAGEGQSREVTS